MSDPASIILVRHARSLANADPAVYRSMRDHEIPLCAPEDDPPAIAAGEAIRTLGLAADSVYCWTSSFTRCRQTEALVLRTAFGDGAGALRRHESFLLRELEYGDWDGLSDEEAAARDPERWARKMRGNDPYSRFYFRAPNGESRADLVLRVATFSDQMRRLGRVHHIVFTHALTLRAFRMMWFNRSIEWFDAEPHPPNAAVVRITHGGNEWQESVLTTAR